MSVKIYDKEKKKWIIFPGTIGAPGKDAYLIAQENGYTGTKEEYIAALTQVPDIMKVIYNQYSSVQLTSNISIFEAGIDTSVILSNKVIYNDEKLVPLKLTLKREGTIISEDVNLTTFNDNINASTLYSIDVEVYPRIIKSSSVRINSYYPLYYGASIKQELTSEDILNLVKQPIKASPAGSVTINVGSDQYIWLCVPSTMNINKVTSSGFEVPMNSKIIVNVEGKTSYNCYRSTNTFTEGIFNGMII